MTLVFSLGRSTDPLPATNSFFPSSYLFLPFACFLEKIDSPGYKLPPFLSATVNLETFNLNATVPPCPSPIPLVLPFRRESLLFFRLFFEISRVARLGYRLTSAFSPPASTRPPALCIPFFRTFLVFFPNIVVRQVQSHPSAVLTFFHPLSRPTYFP